MSDRENQSEMTVLKTRPPLVHWALIMLWWLAIFAVVLASDVDDDVLFAMIVLVIPALLLTIFLVTVPLWILARLLIALYRRRWHTAAACLGVSWPASSWAKPASLPATSG
jgi:hypothetical protein